MEIVWYSVWHKATNKSVNFIFKEICLFYLEFAILGFHTYLSSCLKLYQYQTMNFEMLYPTAELSSTIPASWPQLQKS